MELDVAFSDWVTNGLVLPAISMQFSSNYYYPNRAYDGFIFQKHRDSKLLPTVVQL